jgi:hypothetical protein
MSLFHLLSDCRLFLYPVSKQEEAQYYWLTTDTDKQSGSIRFCEFSKQRNSWTPS